MVVLERQIDPRRARSLRVAPEHSVPQIAADMPAEALKCGLAALFTSLCVRVLLFDEVCTTL